MHVYVQCGQDHKHTQLVSHNLLRLALHQNELCGLLLLCFLRLLGMAVQTVPRAEAFLQVMFPRTFICVLTK